MATEMTTDTIRISAIVPAPPERVYGAWLDSEEHSAITHSTAGVEPWVGGRHSAWGGSIRGTTVELQPNRRIVQTWWASDFPPGSEESRLEVMFEPVPGGTLVTINHTGLPQGRGHRYEDGWKDFYLENMKTYFPAHPDSPAREESPAPMGQMRMDLPAGNQMKPASAPAAASPKAAKKPVKPPAKARPVAKKAPAKKKAVAKKATKKGAKKATKKPARKPAKKAAKKPAKKAAKKATARAKSRPARARKPAPKARKTSGRAGTRRGR